MKEDNSFDELVKNKAEKKKFRYCPLFWLLFAKKAGVAAFSVAQIVAASVVTVSLLAGGTYAIVRNIQKQKTIPTVPVTIVEIEEDSISQPIDTVEIPVEDTIADLKIVTEPVPNPPQVKHQTPPVTTTQPAQNLNSAPDTPKVVRKGVPKYNIRILEIDPDTITSNY